MMSDYTVLYSGLMLPVHLDFTIRPKRVHHIRLGIKERHWSSANAFCKNTLRVCIYDFGTFFLYLFTAVVVSCCFSLFNIGECSSRLHTFLLTSQSSQILPSSQGHSVTVTAKEKAMDSLRLYGSCSLRAPRMKIRPGERMTRSLSICDSSISTSKDSSEGMAPFLYSIDRRRPFGW